jgi:hemerythrin
MTSLPWDQSLATGIDDLDVQHRRLFRAVAVMMDSVHNRDIDKGLQHFVPFIAQHVDEHFDFEEKLMLSRGYPDYLQHKIHHDEMRAKVGAFKEEYSSFGFGPLILMRLGTLLDEWLRKHIYEIDLAMVAWLKQNP